MKIVSLLPSATEIAFALGLGDEVEGRTFECDHPAAAASIPIVSGTTLTTNGSGDAGAIDAEVASRVAGGEPLYALDSARIQQIAPDLILAQDLCRVCAVPSGDVAEALEVIGCTATVVSLDPERLDDVIAGIGTVGAATGRSERAEDLMAELRGRVDAARARVAGLTRPRVLVIEWADPPFNAGHWVPDMVEAAGGESLLARPGGRSRRLDWTEFDAVEPEVVVFAPCGFDLDGAVAQADSLLDRPELARVERIYAVDGNAHYSRPGPRVVDGVEVLAELLHGDDRTVTTWARRLR